MNTNIRTNLISQLIEPLRQKLLCHPLYDQLHSLPDLRVFMEHHVYAVWDFMSLLKSLQRRLTCIEVPWVPQGNPTTRALVNQIVVGEESDRAADGRALSHFELYAEAMREVDANTKAVMRLIELVQNGVAVDDALGYVNVPQCCRQFVVTTFNIIGTGKPHVIAAAFTYGREDLIPGLFGELVARLNEEFPAKVATLRYYLERHIELDGDEHGELGRQMVASLCGNDPDRWNEASDAAILALQARLALWDGIHATLTSRSHI